MPCGKKRKRHKIATHKRKKRLRKNKNQLKVLENEYLKNPDWSREYIKKLSDELGLSECQVYKWRWDQLKKSGIEEAPEHFN